MHHKDMYTQIVRPLVTEKSTHQADRLNAYTFEVLPDANKAQIKQAIEKIYDVKVMKVRTANRPGKKRRMGLRFGKTKNWKKAVVILDPEDRIDLF